MGLKIKIALVKFKNSRFVLGITCLIIGATGMYISIESRELYKFINGGLKIVYSFEKAEASESSRTQGEAVQTATHQGLETPTDNISVDSLIKNTFGSQSEVALAVAKGESNLEPNRIGDTHITFSQDGKTYGMSCGIFQIRILPGRPSCEEMLDPVKNVEYAYGLFMKSGWLPWSVFNSGQYKKFL